MTIIERQHLSISAVRSMCIEENLYTQGTNAEYEAMFSLVTMLYPKQILTAEDLYPIAKDILEHSSTDMDLACILYCLAKKTERLYEVIED